MEPETPEVVPESALAVVAPPIEGADALILNDPAALQAQLASYGEARRLFIEWIMSQLIPGIDFMLIHRKVGTRGAKVDCPEKGNASGRGCQTCGGKSTLCKPGAEKICGLLRLRARFKRDIEVWEMLGSVPGCVALVCELVTASDRVVAEGRSARHQDMDYGDVNKCVKMVEKSGQIDAVLRVAELSEHFSQDVEDMPSFANGGTEPAEFQAPRRKSETTTTATPAPTTLQAQLEESVRRTAPARPTSPRPTPPRPAPRAPTTPAAPPAADGLSDARVRRLMAMLHEALRGAEVDEEFHEQVFERARIYLVEWVGRTQGRERLSDCSWRAYDELCAQIPAAVDAALGGEKGPAPGWPGAKPHPRLVRRYAGPGRNVPRREF